jgi:hypothetical protein
MDQFIRRGDRRGSEKRRQHQRDLPMPNGKEVTYPLEKLSEDSRKTIAGTIKAKE